MTKFSNAPTALAIRRALIDKDGKKRSEAWLARTIGIDPGTFSKKINCKSDWSLSEVFAIANALEVNPAALVASGDQ